MRTISIIYVLAVVLTSCQDIGGESQAPSSTVEDVDTLRTILTSLWSTDTTGQLDSTFHTNEQFYLHFRMVNKTGKDQPYKGTGPTVELAIYQSDSLVASEYRGLAWPAEIYSGVLEREFVGYTRWRAPLMVHNWEHPEFHLEQGTYQAGARIGISFDSAAVQVPRQITLTIIP